jgi:hypothetical protein
MIGSSSDLRRLSAKWSSQAVSGGSSPVPSAWAWAVSGRKRIAARPMILTYSVLGVMPEAAMLVTLVYRGLSFWLPFVTGSVALRRLR